MIRWFWNLLYGQGALSSNKPPNNRTRAARRKRGVPDSGTFGVMNRRPGENLERR